LVGQVERRRSPDPGAPTRHNRSHISQIRRNEALPSAWLLRWQPPSERVNRSSYAVGSGEGEDASDKSRKSFFDV
jgi:hypothetical protein